jgi:hypothetical protein
MVQKTQICVAVEHPTKIIKNLLISRAAAEVKPGT